MAVLIVVNTIERFTMRESQNSPYDKRCNWYYNPVYLSSDIYEFFNAVYSLANVVH